MTREDRAALIFTRQAEAAMDRAEAGYRKRGRPSKGTPKRKQFILDEISKGRFLTEVCRRARIGDEAIGWAADPDFPDDDVVRQWEKVDPDFSSGVARARERGAAALVIDAIAIADRGVGDYLHTPFGMKPSRAAVARNKLQVEVRLRAAEIISPKLKRLQLSEDPESPIGGKKRLSEYTPEELARAYEEVQARAKLK